VKRACTGQGLTKLKFAEKLRHGLGFIGKQERAFKTNMARVSLQTFSLTLTSQYQSIFIVGLGADPVYLGLISGMGGFSSSAVALPTGFLADKHGVRKMLLFGTSLLILGTLLFLLASNWLMIIPAVALAALATRMLQTVCPMVCGNCLKTEERVTVMQLCDTIGIFAPALFSPILAAFVITVFGGLSVDGIRPLYHVQLLFFSLILVLIYALFKDPARLSFSRKPSRFLEGIRELSHTGVVMKRWIAFRSLSDVAFSINVVYLPLYAAKIKDANQFVLGGMAIASVIVPLTLSVLSGKLADNIGRKKTLYLTTPIYCLSPLLLVYASSTAMLIVAGLFQGFLMLGLAVENAMAVELVPHHFLGRWLGILGFFGGIVGLVTPVTAGMLWNYVRPESVFVFLIAAQILKLLILKTTRETLRTIRRTNDILQNPSIPLE
jgi:MFS family permease